MNDIILSVEQQKRLIDSFQEAVEFWGGFDLRELMASPVQKIDLSNKPVLRGFIKVFPELGDILTGQKKRTNMNEVMDGIAKLTSEKIQVFNENNPDSERASLLRDSFSSVVAGKTKGLVFLLEEYFKNGVSDELYKSQRPNNQKIIYDALMETASDINLIPKP